MTALSINMTDREPPTTWADVKPTVRPENRLRSLSYSAWKLAAKLADECNPDWEKINRLQDAARELSKLADADAECSCTPLHDCRVCDLTARVIYDEDYGG